MRELLVTITLLSFVSSEEFEPKKRLGIPPEEEPNFWPTRGRRSYWNNPSLFGYYTRRDLSQNPDLDYAGRSDPWESENDITSSPGVLGYLDTWRLQLCPRKKSISLVLPLEEYSPEEPDLPGCGGRCNGARRGRGRRGGERWRTQQPLYAEEPGWISLNYNRGGLLRDSENEDPFISARGKKRNEEIESRRTRDLGEFLNPSQISDPFFVARGKRNAITGVNDPEKSTALSLGTPNEKKESNYGEPEVSSTTNRKFYTKGSGDYKNPVLTAPGAKENGEARHPRSQRSSTDLFSNDDGKWVSSDVRRVAGPETNEEFRVVKPRYSRPRDKHSNLQSILDEPFFISRGKKKEDEPEPGVEYLRDDRPRIKIDVDMAEEVVREMFDRLKPGNFDDNRVKKSKILGNKPPRNRRGMLDDLLKSDDPFYVARGKKFYPQNGPASEYLDFSINLGNDAADADNKLSIIAKSTRTKLLQKLNQFSKILPHDFGRRDFSNLTNNRSNYVV